MLCAGDESAMQTASERESAAMLANFFSQREGDALTDHRLKSTQ
jgi:hypothetical protein